MEIPSKAMVSISDMIKNFKGCRTKADAFGKLFILKNNQLDSVLFSIKEYEKISVLLDYMESIEEQDLAMALASLPNNAKDKSYSIKYFKNEAQLVISIDEVMKQETS